MIDEYEIKKVIFELGKARDKDLVMEMVASVMEEFA